MLHEPSSAVSERSSGAALVGRWDRVHVEDPNLSPLFSPFVGTVVYVNGDMVDVADDDGDIDCFPAAWVVPMGSPFDRACSHPGSRATLLPMGRTP